MTLPKDETLPPSPRAATTVDSYFEHDHVARIIDPEAFAGYDAAYAARAGFDQLQLVGRLNVAREKARAIAALVDKACGDRGEDDSDN